MASAALCGGGQGLSALAHTWEPAAAAAAARPTQALQQQLLQGEPVVPGTAGAAFM